MTLSIAIPSDVPLLAISSAAKPLITVKQDGTVVVHEYGADKEAARMFYESLHLEGTTLYQKVAEQADEIERLRADRDRLLTTLRLMDGSDDMPPWAQALIVEVFTAISSQDPTP